jgi:hypothetical protein
MKVETEQKSWTIANNKGSPYITIKDSSNEKFTLFLHQVNGGFDVILDKKCIPQLTMFLNGMIDVI